MSMINIFRLLLFGIAIVLVSSCQSQMGPTMPHPIMSAEQHAVYERKGNVTVGAYALSTESDIIRWLGKHFLQYNNVAIHVSIENDAIADGNIMFFNEQIIFGEKGGFANSQTDLIRQGVNSEERTKAALDGLLTGGLLTASVMWLNAERLHSVNESVLRERMLELILHTDTLRPGQMASGFIYFPIQPQWNINSVFTLALALKNTKTGEVIPFMLEFSGDKQPFIPAR